ncbi:MAG TPA: hypothetical protein VFW33_19805 [Gemmataceae bacterium]|nr:hypothetical protein [Gemmataceae bacterium]
MGEQTNNVVSGPEGAPKRNAGWFQRGDGRINCGGRPRKAWADCADRAPFADRLMLLWVPQQDLARLLAGDGAPAIVNLPADFKSVAFRVDAARDAVAVIGRSASFPQIPKGAPVPEFKPETAPPADRAPCDDRLKVLWVPGKALAQGLSQQNAPWVVNLPEDREVVASRFDGARNAGALVIRSASFPLVAKGAVIPEFEPVLHGTR